MKKIAAITQARNDNFFLSRWINYYGKELGEENLYIFLDGEDQVPPDNAGNTNITIRKKEFGLSRAKGEHNRLKFLSEFAEKLFTEQGYDLVIGVDCDEFLVVEPHCNAGLQSYLSTLPINHSVSALGIDVGHRTDKEQDLDPNQSILQQRHFGVLSPRYTKPSVIAEPLRWGAGFHRIKGKNFTIDKNLFLFHIGYCDMGLVKARLDPDKVHNDWEAHIKRQARTITLVTENSAKEGDIAFSQARTIQTFCRPLYALNKPTMLGMKWVVEIPERFQQVFI